jgi:nucleotide-binding universal stress UspA family protein
MSAPRVVVGYDEGEQSHDALALGELLCDALGGKLVLAHVYPFDPRLRTLSYEDEREAARKAAEELLRDAPLGRFRKRNVERVAVPASSPAHGLDQLVRDRDAGLIVLGSVHRAPMQRVFPGSVALKLLHGGPCPVAVAPRGYASEPHELRTVVAAFDGNEEGRHAVLEAAASPRRPARSFASWRLWTPSAPCTSASSETPCSTWSSASCASASTACSARCPSRRTARLACFAGRCSEPC